MSHATSCCQKLAAKICGRATTLLFMPNKELLPLPMYSFSSFSPKRNLGIGGVAAVTYVYGLIFRPKIANFFGKPADQRNTL